MTQSTVTTTDKLRAPLDTSTVMAFSVFGLLLLALLIAAFITKDAAVVSDLSKNFIGPALLLVVGYYFGSSSASKRKDETISNLSEGSHNERS